MNRMTKSLAEYQSQLRTAILKIADVPEPELSELIHSFTLERIPKKTVILAEGDFSEDSYFILEGLVRIFYVKEDKEITNWFINENMFFAAIYAILTGEKNINNYITLEDTICLKIKYSTMVKFYEKYHSLEHFGRKLIELYYSLFMKKSNEILFLSAEERYNTFLKERGDLLNRIPLRYISSYLGITQETLSRLRAKH